MVSNAHLEFLPNIVKTPSHSGTDLLVHAFLDTGLLPMESVLLVPMVPSGMEHAASQSMEDLSH